MYAPTNDDIITYLENPSILKGFEFLEKMYEKQPIFKDFLSENFEKVMHQNVYLLLLQLSAQFFDLIERKNSNLPIICKESIEECFNKNLALGVRIKEAENREEVLEYIIANHKYEKLLRMAVWSSTNYLNDFLKDTNTNQESIYKLIILCFIVSKTLVEACEKEVKY